MNPSYRKSNGGDNSGRDREVRPIIWRNQPSCQLHQTLPSDRWQCVRVSRDSEIMSGAWPLEMSSGQLAPLAHPRVIFPLNHRATFPNCPIFQFRNQGTCGMSIMDMTQDGTCGRVSRAWPTQ